MSLALKDTPSLGIGLLPPPQPAALGLRQELLGGLAEFADDEAIRCVILTGGTDIPTGALLRIGREALQLLMPFERKANGIAFFIE